MKQRLELTWFNKDKALIPAQTGKYGYTWVSPSDPRYCETHRLIVDEVVKGQQGEKLEGQNYSDRADLEPQSDNLMICGESGDALEALTRVPELAEKYVGKVKCVYIDPPFNTAQTFANYEDNLEHSVWLAMMRDRLIHLRSLLSEDGSIWIHLDDVEIHRMRSLLDEIFGSGNFVSEVAWEKVYSPRGDAKEFSKRIDYLLVYRKSSLFSLNTLNKPADLTQFKLTDEDGAHYRSDPLRKWGKNSLRSDRPNLWYPVTAPDGTTVWPIKPDGTESCWRWGEKTFKERYDELDWLDKGNGIQPYVRQYAESSGTRPPESLWLSKDVGHSQEGKEEIKALFPGVTPFTTPKPERLLERVLHISTNPGDLVVDVFAGSGTTAAVAQKMGRRWIAVELVADTFNRFTRPRLQKVINGEDQGGITTTVGQRIDITEDGLPEGVTADDAHRFTALLNKVLNDNEDLKKDSTVKTLKALTKTKKSPDTINWRGGGGFTVAKLSPACFDYNEELDLVTLTEHATGQTLIDSVAAQLRFYLTPNDRYFHGQIGIQHLVVIEGVLDNEKVDDLMSHLPQGHCLVFAATIINEETRDHVRSFRNGSRVVSIPHDLFTYSKNQEVK